MKPAAVASRAQILVIEDNSSDVFLLKRALKSAESFDLN